MAVNPLTDSPYHLCDDDEEGFQIKKEIVEEEEKKQGGKRKHHTSVMKDKTNKTSQTNNNNNNKKKLSPSKSKKHVSKTNSSFLRFLEPCYIFDANWGARAIPTLTIRLD